MESFTHDCNIAEEPLECYRAGGYHPIVLGDLFKNGRYKVLHKLGWGGYSTVWAAKDLKTQEYVALKVSVAKTLDSSQELKVLRTLANLHSEETGSSHIVKLLDHFQIVGPNGRHQCLVLEFLGPNVSDVCDMYLGGGRFPTAIANNLAKQALAGLAYLHRHNIAHGDLHTRNMAFVIPSLHTLTEAELLKALESPETSPVRRIDGKPLGPDAPEYIIGPVYYPIDMPLSNQHIKIIDFGESFFNSDVPDKLHTPLSVRAPEIIFEQKLDYRVDLWSAGCMIYELIVGQPPFGGVELPVILVYLMLDMISDEFPERWQEKWQTMNSTWAAEKFEFTFQEWLEKLYFKSFRKVYLTHEEIGKFGALVQRLLRFEPSTRATVQEILQYPWFKQS